MGILVSFVYFDFSELPLQEWRVDPHHTEKNTSGNMERFFPKRRRKFNEKRRRK